MRRREFITLLGGAASGWPLVQIMANRVISLTALAMLTFAAMIIPVAAQNSKLTPELLSKILDYDAKTGADRDVPAIVASGVGLTAAGQSWPMRQIGMQENTSGVLHGIAISRGSDKDILLNVTTKERVNVYRMQRDGTLVVAGVYDIQARRFTTRDRATAQKELEHELDFWSVCLDGL